MKTITISLCDRPKYTGILFDHLSKCDNLNDYKITIFCEPVNSEVINMAKKFTSDVRVNETRLGCNLNILQCLSFGLSNSEYHIHFEDDTIPSKDCLTYFEWCNDKYKNDKEIFAIRAWGERVKPKNLDTSALKRGKCFCPWGWATWKDRFNLIENDLLNSIHYYKSISWDVLLSKIINQQNLSCISPIISRIQNIGAEGGVHVPSKEWHKLNHEAEYWMEDDKRYVDNFHEVNFEK